MGLEGLPWRSSGWNSALPLQGAWLDPLSGTKIPHAPQQGQKNRFWILFPSKCFPTSLTCHLSLVNPGWHIYLFLFLTLKVRCFFYGYIFHSYLPERYSFTGECFEMSSWKQLGNVCKNTDSSYPVIQLLRNYSVGINLQRELFLTELFF